LLAGLLLTGCQKNPPLQKTAGPVISVGTNGSQAETNAVTRDLGAVTLTNHYETCMQLGAGKDCIFTPKLIDSHNVQLTLSVESKTATGKTHDLSITQIVAPTGKPLEVAVGDFNFTLTPNVASE
jgi:hypothetical protein